MPSDADDDTRLCDIFLIVRQVIDSLAAQGALRFPVPIAGSNGILAIIEAQAADAGITRIDLFCRDWRAQQFHSALFRYEDRAEIHYSAHSRLDWRRLAICKEAMHLLIDKKPYHFTTDAAFLIERIILGEMVAPDTPVASEWMGEIAAIEAVLPWKLRPVLEKMHIAGESDYQIAVQFRVPVKYVTAMLHGTYGKVSASINTQLDRGPVQADDEATSI